MKIDKKKMVMGLLTIFVIFACISLAKLAYKVPDNDQIAKNSMDEFLKEDEREILEEENVSEDTSDEESDELEEEGMISAISTTSSNITTTSSNSKVSTDSSEKNTNVVKETKTGKKSTNSASDYKVAEGDTLFLISQKTNVSVNELKAFNNLDSDIIHVGQNLKLTGGSSGNNEISNTNSPSRGDNYRDEDLYWLSRIIHAEAQGESYQGKVAVGNVVLNRVKSSEYPNSIYGVIFDKKDGYIQFSPVIDGSIYNTPDSESINAAKEALSGARPVGDALYFLNPSKSTNFWIIESRQHMTTIGKHDFYY